MKKIKSDAIEKCEEKQEQIATTAAKEVKKIAKQIPEPEPLVQ